MPCDYPEAVEFLVFSALGNYESYVVVLLVRAESPNFIDNRAKHELRRQFTMSPQCFDKLVLAEVLSSLIE
jgi:hypothetical protein